MNRKERQLRKAIRATLKRLRGSQMKYINKATEMALYVDYEGGEVFRFADYPELLSKTDELEELIALGLADDLRYGINTEWMAAQKYCDLLAKDVYKGLSIKSAVATQYMRRSSQLTFLQRARDGMKLSERIWNLTGSYKTELEAAISCAMERGMSAITLSKRISKYLNNYDELKQDYGERFGAATDIHDCEYCSARLARTEINMAYRTAEQERWKNQDFVIGYQIKMSDSHPELDVCDELQGFYPKDFHFVGWHPNCLCMALPVTMNSKDFERYLNGETVEPKGEIKDVPEAFKSWVCKNEDRILRSKNMPYFIEDNMGYVQKALKCR